MCIVLTVPLAVGAQVTNRAQVGVSGRNDTKGYAPSLAIVFASPSSYGAGCCVDSDSGEWKGPRYAGTKANTGGDSTIDWRTTFTRASASPQGAAQANLVQHWPQLSTSTLAVPHTVAGTKVGTISGYVLTTRAPGSGAAQMEAALAFRLCKGLFVVAGFSLLAPQQDPDGLGGAFLVNGQSASSWNAAQAAAALQGVSVDGNLPPRSIVARASGRRIVGVARDCLGQPLVRLAVHLAPGGAVARTSSTGSFSVVVAKPGTYKITTALAGVSASSRPVSIR